MRINWGLVGRSDELDQITDALTRVGSFGVFISGVAGIGKTRLAHEAIELAGERGAHTEWVAATRAASLLPFGALLQLLSEPPTSLATVDGSAVGALTGALRVRSGGRPVVLAIDDVHLLDEGAAAIVHYLATTGQATFVMTAREGEPLSDALTSLRKDDLADWIELRRLSPPEVGELMTSVLHGPVASETTARLSEQSEGNPLMLREIVQQSLDDDRFVFSGLLWHWEGLATPGPRLHNLIAEHLRRLPDEARRVLDLVGFGQPLPAEVLHRLADLRVEAMLVNEGLIEFEQQNDRLIVRIAHPLYAEFVRHNTNVPAARELMQTLATATLETGEPNHEEGLQLARWWVDAGLTGDQGILARAAADSVVLGHPQSAQDFARAALAHGPHFDALLALAEAGKASLDEAHLWQLFAEARLLATADVEMATWAIAVLRAFPTNFSDPEALANMADEVIGALHDLTLQDLVRGQLAICFAAAGRSQESQALADRLLASADDLVRIRALFAGSTAAVLGGRGESIDSLSSTLLEPSFRLEEQFPGTLDLVRMAKLGSLLALGRFGDLTALLGDYTATASSVTPEFSCFISLLTGLISLMEGRVRQATQELSEAFDLCQSWKSMFAAWSGGLLVQALATRGEMEDAERIAQRIDALAPMEPYDADRVRSASWLLVGRGELRLARDRFIAVADRSRQHGRAFHEMAALHDALRVGATDIAPRLVAVAAQVEGVWAGACGAHAMAMLSNDGAQLEGAAERFTSIGFHLHATEAFTQAAAAHQRAGQHSSSNRAALKATAEVARCEGAATPLTTMPMLVDPLTDRELQVAALAAKGQTSRQISTGLSISVRTVDNLLQRVYRKLGISARTELAQAMARSAEA